MHVAAFTIAPPTAARIILAGAYSLQKKAGPPAVDGGFQGFAAGRTEERGSGSEPFACGILEQRDPAALAEAARIFSPATAQTGNPLAGSAATAAQLLGRALRIWAWRMTLLRQAALVQQQMEFSVTQAVTPPLSLGDFK